MRKLPTVAALAFTSLAHIHNALGATLVVTDVAAVYPNNAGIVEVEGQDPPPWTTPMVFTTSGGTFITYCDDLGHDVFIEGGQHLLYTIGLVTTDGEGHAISEAISNVMGQIARIGLTDMALGHNPDPVIAANAAIWALEYHTLATSTDSGVQAFIDYFETDIHDDGQGFAQGLISLDGAQSQILASAAIPETTTWLMLLLGFGTLGYVGYNRRLARVVL